MTDDDLPTLDDDLLDKPTSTPTRRDGPTFIRAAHGTGRDAILRVEVPPLDELPDPNAARTERALATREARGRPFEPGNAAAKGRRPKLARMPDSVATAHPSWSAYEKQARRYVQRRCRELAVQTGVPSLGTGPSALLASAGLARAASMVLYEMASEKLDPALFRDAARLADSARQQELTAVGLAEREAKALGIGEQDPASVALQERLAAIRRQSGT